MFEKRVWLIPRQRPDIDQLQCAVKWIRESKAPLIVTGGGVHYSEAYSALRAFVQQTGIPVGETQAGKGSLPYNHPFNLGAVGATGTEGANIIAREADLIIGIGTRYSDFTTASKTAFQNPDVRFVNINVAAFDAYKHNALPLIGDARAILEELLVALGDWRTPDAYQARCRDFNAAWDREVHRIYNLEHEPLLSQGEVIGMVNTFSRPQDVLLCAAGSLPGDLHKLWRTRDPRGYHLEYGYSCMGYEIAGGMGAAMAAPDRDVYVMVGDGSYLMMNAEIVTMVQEHIKVIIVVLDNHGFASIGGLSKSIGSEGFGTKYRYRTESNHLDGETLPVDYAQNCDSLGAYVIKATTREAFMKALEAARQIKGKPVCIVTEVDRRERVPGYESWWDVAVAQVSENPEVQKARAQYEDAKKRERRFV
jgi:3D-(3,5/4)-trihydroxycyclohexane-1,2-dione acylhydrolase (decyclizing)